MAKTGQGEVAPLWVEKPNRQFVTVKSQNPFGELQTINGQSSHRMSCLSDNRAAEQCVVQSDVAGAAGTTLTALRGKRGKMLCGATD